MNRCETCRWWHPEAVPDWWETDTQGECWHEKLAEDDGRQLPEVEVVK